MKSDFKKQFTIEPGDTVSVSFHNAKFILCSRAIVRYVPTATGESWIFHDLDNDELHYVSEGCTVTLIKKKINNKISISQFMQNYSGKMTKAMNEALFSIRDNEHVKFIEDIEYINSSGNGTSEKWPGKGWLNYKRRQLINQDEIR